MSYLLVFGLGAAAGVAGTLYWPTVKTWFSDESAAIASAVKARI